MVNEIQTLLKTNGWIRSTVIPVWEVVLNGGKGIASWDSPYIVETPERC